MGELNKQSTYTWTPESDKMIRISKSTLDTFSNWCGQQLWLDKHIQLPQEEHDYLVIGDNVHNRQEEYYDICGDNIDLIEEAIQHAKDGKDKRAYDILKSLYPKAEGLYEEREAAIQDWMIKHDLLRLAHCDSAHDFLPVANEIDLDAVVELDIPDHGPVTVHLRGIIDRVFRSDDGIALMELKTGKYNKRYTPPKMKGEMAYYAYMLQESETDLGPVTHWGWRFPAADAWDYEPMKKASVTAAKKRIIRLIKAYLEQDFPVVKDGARHKCGYCDYMPYCPLYTVYENPIEVANGAEPIFREAM